MGIQVDLRGLDRFVTQPKSDHRWLNAALEQLHRSRVSHEVWRDVLVPQGWALQLRRRGVLGNKVLHSVCTHTSAVDIGEQEFDVTAHRLLNPDLQHIDRLHSEWCAAFFATFTQAADVRTSTQLDVAPSERGHLRQP